MRRLNRPTGNIFLDISKQNDMYFVYAFFFESGEDILVKIGISTVPYKRLKGVIHGSPFPISQAVYCHAGSRAVARQFEERVRHAMSGRRTRGEWYAFKPEEGKVFRAGIAVAFAKSVGKPLQWTKIDIESVMSEGREDASRWQRRRKPTPS